MDGEVDEVQRRFVRRWENTRQQLHIPMNDFTVKRLSIYCTLCHATLCTITPSAINSHYQTRKHINVVEMRARGRPRVRQETHELVRRRENAFYKELCEAFNRANIPVEKLKHPDLRSFLERYTQQNIPDPSTLRKRYVNICYNEVLEKIRTEIGDNPILIQVDETTDSQKRCVAHIIVTPLFRDHAGEPRLLNCDVIERADADHIVQFVNDSLEILWPGGLHEDRVLFLLSDSVRYMKRAGRNLVNHFPLMIQVTCINHALHLVATEIMHEYPHVNDIIADTKKIFLKAPRRIQLFHELAPGIPLPPEPIITRWGTWIRACSYYAIHFVAVRNVIRALPPETPTIINMKRLFENDDIYHQFVLIHEKFSCIADAITMLETRGLHITASINILGDVIRSIQGDEEISVEIKNKLEQVFGDNVGFCESVVALVNCITHFVDDDLPPGWNPQLAELVNFLPLVTCDVERSFSEFKALLTRNRASTLFTNLRHLVIIHCFHGR